MAKSKQHTKKQTKKANKAKSKKRADTISKVASVPSSLQMEDTPELPAKASKRQDLVFAGNLMIVLFSVLFIMASQSALGKYYATRFAAIQADLQQPVEIIANAKNTSFHANLKYHYTYEGKPYQTSKSIHSFNGKSFKTRERIKQHIVQAYPDSKLTIYVNPQKPEQSVLSNQGPTGSDYFACLFVGVLWSLGWLVIWLGLHPDKLPRKKSVV